MRKFLLNQLFLINKQTYFFSITRGEIHQFWSISLAGICSQFEEQGKSDESAKKNVFESVLTIVQEGNLIVQDNSNCSARQYLYCYWPCSALVNFVLRLYGILATSRHLCCRAYWQLWCAESSREINGSGQQIWVKSF